MEELNDERVLIKELSNLILAQNKREKTEERNEKIKKLLLILGTGAALAVALTAPGTAKILKDFLPKDSDWDEWKHFNKDYLKRTLRRLEKEKVVEISSQDGVVGTVTLTEKGRKRVITGSMETLKIPKPLKWDGKWRLVFYDIKDKRDGLRDQLRRYLLGAGFYPLQESVYLHAYPCEREINFLRYFLGVNSEVWIVLAEHIENDDRFRTYFDI